MDEWGVDLMVTACQKGLMTPPGISFVFFSDKAAAVRNAMTRVGSYWDWNTRINPEYFYQYFCGTAPTQHLLGLREALDMILEEELSHVWARHEAIAQAVWAACEAWGQGGPLKMNIAEPALRSRAVTALSIGAPNGLNLRLWTEHQAGLTLGIGLNMATADDPNADGFFRIGHMGHVNAHMIMGTLGAIQSGLMASDIPHGAGGLEAAARVLAEATHD
jgi:alanine-glyoxylate transaminase/serine-glyoxylate transaminase/serine-pyruvate transaminase